MHVTRWRRRREKETEAVFEAIITENYPQINVRHQTTDPGSLEDTKQHKCQQNYTSAYHFQITVNHIFLKLTCNIHQDKSHSVT